MTYRRFDTGRLYRTASIWRGIVMAIVVVAVVGWVFAAAGTAEEYDGISFFLVFIPGAVGVILLAGLYVLLSRLLEGVAAVVDLLDERLPSTDGAASGDLQVPRSEE
jgi:hypothetical protein